ncbi:MAG: hypothetical protein IJ348_03100 [Alistipes sp.]|nr:hypothetical protein [Alistipes sp.]
MKKIFVLAVSVVLAVTMTSCGNRNAKSKSAEPATVEAVAEAVAALEVDAVLEGADALVDKEVEVEAICTHLCRHGATKMFLLGSDDTKTIRVEAAKLGAFDQKCANSIVKVRGIVREERIDESYLQQWEQMVGADHHGDGESGCSTEKAARGETGNTTAQRIADFRARIAAREKAEGKAYLSFYYIEALSYEVVEG